MMMKIQKPVQPVAENNNAGQSLCRENHCGDRKGGALHPR